MFMSPPPGNRRPPTNSLSTGPIRKYLSPLIALPSGGRSSIFYVIFIVTQIISSLRILRPAQHWPKETTEPTKPFRSRSRSRRASLLTHIQPPSSPSFTLVSFRPQDRNKWTNPFEIYRRGKISEKSSSSSIRRYSIKVVRSLLTSLNLSLSLSLSLACLLACSLRNQVSVLLCVLLRQGYVLHKPFSLFLSKNCSLLLSFSPRLLSLTQCAQMLD